MENMVSLPSSAFWSRKRVLVTGHTGFKGSWLCHWLLKMNSTVTGIALENEQEKNLFNLLKLDSKVDSHISDLRNQKQTLQLVRNTDPEIVFHLAAQPLVREGYRTPVETFSTNILGTVHLLDAIRHTPSVKAVVVITTDKVYHNQNWVHPYRESDRLGGHDPYSASKAACEIVVDSYRKSFLNSAGIKIATVRAGNVFGGGDWAAERLVPDIIRTWLSGRSLTIRSPSAIRPWQHVLEPLCGYLSIAEQLHTNQNAVGAFNIGPDYSDQISVLSLIQKFQHALGSGEFSVENDNLGMHETDLLFLDNSKAKNILGIKPRWNIDQAIRRTAEWHKKLDAGEFASRLCSDDITFYETSNE
ncbi:WcaG Nucleoside-diphosphate-sugar epimerases [Oxalobacteraceae bacterium]